jgi:prepilin-type processing-associated H-X9-DG protein
MLFNRSVTSRTIIRLFSTATLVAVVAAGSIAQADAIPNLSNFSGSNLVLMRGGDSANPQSTFGSGEVPAYLDQYSVTVSGGVATGTQNRTNDEVWAAARSRHPGGVVVLYADGSVHFETDQIDPAAWTALSTRAGDDVAP